MAYKKIDGKNYHVHQFKNGVIFCINMGLRKCVTFFPDGTRADAVVIKGQDEFARSLGYRSAWSMVWHREFIHTWLMQEMGLKWSNVLWDIAHGISQSPVHWAEEEWVLRLQRIIANKEKPGPALQGVSAMLEAELSAFLDRLYNLQFN